jgi:hypothetical protein
MPAAVHLLGIRHHGPGSARQVLHALAALRPATVLIEGPADATALLPLLADPAMVPPVALLTYAEADPSRAVFFPFAAYSPEYQAALWALRLGAALRFIDLPASDVLAAAADDADAAADQADQADPAGGDGAGRDPRHDPVHDPARDPLGALARAAGYDDGESWWSDVIEENPAPGPVFAAVAQAMAALRADETAIAPREAAREAHMRLEIAKDAKGADACIAVVCGAWHVPALARKVPASADRETLKAWLKGRPKTRVKATWAPWTAPRLARQSGYGAGVAAPGWCAHLWRLREGADRDECSAAWLARIARQLRDKGHFVSTASVIEAQRLGNALAALRRRPAPGFAELRDAALASLCHGEALLWRDIAAPLLIGAEVGAIAPDTPLAPLLEDLQRQQKATRLKPEALERELTLDLRSDAGLARSTLLHRLAALDVSWGRLTDAGRSRGTFRENWRLCWEPEFAVRLVEHLVHGPTIEQAAASRVIDAMRAAPDLGALAARVRAATIADLPQATAFGIAALQTKAAHTSDGLALLTALPPLADIARYGEARAGTAEQMGALLPRIVVQAALALPYAARNLDDAGATQLRAAMLDADAAIALAQAPRDVVGHWRDALRALLAQTQTTRLLAGVAARLLYEVDDAVEGLSPAAVADILSRMLSPGTPVAEAAGFFEGFFDGAGERLIHDAPLRQAVDGWLLALDEDAFSAHLPLLRRVFSGLDRSERRRLMDALAGRHAGGGSGCVLLPGAAARWPAHQARVLDLLEQGRPR